MACVALSMARSPTSIDCMRLPAAAVTVAGMDAQVVQVILHELADLERIAVVGSHVAFEQVCGFSLGKMMSRMSRPSSRSLLATGKRPRFKPSMAVSTRSWTRFASRSSSR